MPQVVKLSNKVIIIPDASLPRGVSCAMKIITSDGNEYEAQVDYAKGSKENPMTDTEHKEKFRSLAASLLSENKMIQVITMADNLEEIEDISQLTSLLY